MSDLLFSVFDLWTVTVSRYSGVMAESIFVLNKLKSLAENLVKRTSQTRSLVSKSTQPHIAARNWAKDLIFISG